VVDQQVDIEVRVRGEDRTWVLEVARRGRDWLLELQGDERTWSADGPDLFEALRVLRAELDDEEILMGCNGARSNAWASGMQRDMGEGKTVYLCALNLNARPPVARTLDPAPLDEVATVSEQDEFHRRWLASRARRTEVKATPIELPRVDQLERTYEVRLRRLGPPPCSGLSGLSSSHSWPVSGHR
jgi:hypothetical protein